MIDVIGAPFDLGGSRLGSRLGPVAIRLADLTSTLQGLGLEVDDRGDLSVKDQPSDPGGFRAFESLLSCVQGLRSEVARSLRADHMPIVLGGDHTLAVGGISAALELFKRDLAVLWIDAHADVNTPETSISGNLHGMPVSALLGTMPKGDSPRIRQWRRLLNTIGPEHLSPSQVAWYGLRDVDEPERVQVKQGFSITMHEIDRYGIEETVGRLDRFWRSSGSRSLWISFDVDALDPILAPGTGTAVRGGLSYREAHLLTELLHEQLSAPDCPYRLVGMDLVETNPLADTGNETAKMAVEWIASLFGKTILGDGV